MRKTVEAFMERRGLALADWLRIEREGGHSPELVAKRLYMISDGVLDVTKNTVARWLLDLDAAA